MKIEKILEYQKKDYEIIKLERQLENNEDKKIYQNMISVVKDAQNKSNALDNEANYLIQDYNKLEKTYNENLKSCGVVLNAKIDKVSENDLSNLTNVASDLINNMSILEKKLMYLAERVNAILSEFEATKKRYNVAKQKYSAHKTAYDKKQSEIMPEIERKKQDIKKLEDGIDPVYLAKYKQRRADKMYPVLVPLTEKSCGGCRMELPSASLQKLKENGFLECEHCRRIIYFDGK